MTDAEFETFHAETSGPLYAYLLRVGGVQSLVEDLVQTAYLKLLTSKRVPRNDRARKVYLFRIARNLLNDEFRRRAKHRRHAPDGWEEGGPWTAEDGARPDAGLDCESRIEVRRAYGALSARDRELLWLAYVVGLSHKEIEEVAGVAAASVRVLLHRARGRFSERLDGRGIGPEHLT